MAVETAAGVQKAQSRSSPKEGDQELQSLAEKTMREKKRQTSSGTVEEEEVEEESATFRDLGIHESLCEGAAALGWSKATKIQRRAIPVALKGRDVIGLAETGSGKTGAFSLPILHALLNKPQRLFALVLAPTRELAFQIAEQLEALGAPIGVKCVTVVGGVDMMTQAVALARKPHVVISTPGRLVDHLENTKGFSLRSLKFLVLDEADRMLSMDFEEELNKILRVIPSDRRTFLFSATMTSKVAKLQRASLVNPVKVEVSHKFGTPEQLRQYYLFLPAKYQDTYLAYLCNEFAGQAILIFAGTCSTAQRLTVVLRNLGFEAVCLHGQLSQPKRLGALHKFKAGQRNVLIATDVASRGLDIPAVDVVLNFDIPTHGKDYIHRVGRTARAGRSGVAVSFVTQYDVEHYQRIEHLLGKKLEAFPLEEEAVMVLLERVAEAQRIAALELRESNFGKKKGKRGKAERGTEPEDGPGNAGKSQQKRAKTGKGWKKTGKMRP